MSRGPRRRVIGTVNWRPTASMWPGWRELPSDADTLSCWHEVPCNGQCRTDKPHLWRYCGECAGLELAPEARKHYEAEIRKVEADLLDPGDTHE